MAPNTSGETSLVVRAVWFLLVGWWITGGWLTVAWFLNITIVGLPLGIKMINLTPLVLTLKNRRMTQFDVGADGEVSVRGVEQRPLAVRGLYFLLVGWWFSGIWMAVAYLISLSIVGLPIAIWMFNRLPAVVSLYRY